MDGADAQSLSAFRLRPPKPVYRPESKGIELTPYTPLRRDLLDTIWRDSAKLRNGDPDAPPPPPRNKGGRPKKGTPNRTPRKEVRWKESDWRIPQPEAYQILLQGLGWG
jgi:hypothetical protein